MAEAPKSDGLNLRNIEQSSISSVVNLLRLTNVLNAALLMAASIVYFMKLGSAFNLAAFLSAIYIILFSLLLCCFECHLKRFDRYVFVNFGFMFYWGGRLLFFFFVGSLSFGLDILGIIAGCATVVNVLFNIYVLKMHAGYRKMLQEKTQLYKSQAAAHELQAINRMEAGTSSGVSVADAQRAAAFYSDNKQAVDQAAHVAHENRDLISKAV